MVGTIGAIEQVTFSPLLVTVTQLLVTVMCCQASCRAVAYRVWLYHMAMTERCRLQRIVQFGRLPGPRGYPLIGR
jgi:hypothetical protein